MLLEQSEPTVVTLSFYAKLDIYIYETMRLTFPHIVLFAGMRWFGLIVAPI